MNYNFRKLGMILTSAALLVSASALGQSRLLIEDATTHAIAALGGNGNVWFAKGDTREEKGVQVWRFNAIQNGVEFQVRINAFTGSRIKVDRNGANVSKPPAITMNRAAQIGRGTKPGFVWKVEPALFNAVPEWSVKITGKDSKEYDVRINMSTGVIRRTEVRGGGRR